MPLLHRTIKLMLATCLAVLIANSLELAYSTSTGIIAILSVTDTRRSTVRLARDRFLSTLLALTIGSLTLNFFGFNLGALALYISIYIPLAFHLGWEIGITPSTVLVTHLLLEKSTSWSLLGNELALFLIGSGFALLANLYMPSRQQEIDSYHAQVEEQLKKILLRFEYFLKAGDGRNDATLIKELDATLDQTPHPSKRVQLIAYSPLRKNPFPRAYLYTVATVSSCR